ncbi:MAG: hypothetical protein AAF916_01685 [Planctomycetota bacterium]
MFDRQIIGVFAVSVSCGLIGFSASADIIYPGPFGGTNVTYTDVVEATGNPLEDPEPLFGAPTIVSGDLLDFDPTPAFLADAPPTDTTDGALSFIATANTGTLTELVISESGTYAFTGVDNDELVAATLLVRVSDPVTNAELLTDQIVFSQQYDTAPSQVGVWSQSLTLDLTPFAASSVEVQVNNILQTTGVGPGTAVISKTDFNVTPEPAAASLLAGLGLALLRRR